MVTRCDGCPARLDPTAPADHPQHVWVTYWSPDPLCRRCFRVEARHRQLVGDWPAERTAA